MDTRLVETRSPPKLQNLRSTTSNGQHVDCGVWTPLTTLQTSARVLFCSFDGDLVLRSFFLICWDIWLEGSMMSKQVFPIRILWPLCIRNCWNMELISWEFCYEMSFQVLPSITGGATCISIGIGVCIIIQQSGSNAEIFEFSSKERWINRLLIKAAAMHPDLRAEVQRLHQPRRRDIWRVSDEKDGGHCSWANNQTNE